MKNNNGNDTCGAKPSRTTAGERPRYFPRQLVTDEDMMMEQEYFRNRLRLHNRLLHGWGVVCGLQVAPVTNKDGNGGLEPWKIKVCPGHALGPYGDDITMPCEVEMDLRQDSVSGSSVEPCGSISDVWCSDAPWNRNQDQILYVAIKYAEIPTRPVRIQPIGCGCDDNACEFSRLRDGYVLKVLTEDEFKLLSFGSETQLLDWQNLFPGTSPSSGKKPNPACWQSPDQPWIVLASVNVDATSGKIAMVDNCKPRRLVAALGGFYWSCAGSNVQFNLIDISYLDGNIVREPIRRNQDIKVTVMGRGFQTNLKIDFGNGIRIKDSSLTGDAILTLLIHIDQNAEPGNRDLILINPDCSTAIRQNIFIVSSDTSPTQVRTQLTEEAPVKKAEVAKPKYRTKPKKSPNG